MTASAEPRRPQVASEAALVPRQPRARTRPGNPISLIAVTFAVHGGRAGRVGHLPALREASHVVVDPRTTLLGLVLGARHVTLGSLLMFGGVGAGRRAPGHPRARLVVADGRGPLVRRRRRDVGSRGGLTSPGYVGTAPLAAHLGLTPTLLVLAVVPVGACALALCAPDLRGSRPGATSPSARNGSRPSG